MLADRILNALEVLGGDATVGGSLREQAGTYLGEPATDEVMGFLTVAAQAVEEHVSGAMEANGFTEDQIEATGHVAVLLAGIAIGKRLGIEDGERMPHVD